MLYLSQSLEVEKKISTSVGEADWDKNQLSHGASFLQSLEWAKFQHGLGLNYYLLSDDGWSCLVFEKTNRFGKYLFAPYGPTLSSANHLSDALMNLIKLARLVKADWIKIEPVINNGDLAGLKHSLTQHKAVRAVHDLEPALTRHLDISAPVEDLLATVSQSTRSFIRKNQREQFVTFKTSHHPDDMSIFSQMLDTVAERNQVGFFSANYFRRQAEQLMPSGMLHLELAFHNDKPIGAAVMHDFGDTCSYTYAASLPDARKLSVSALLLWEAIVNAKGRGLKKMDLYGTAPDDAPPSHPWYGFSTYKKKFGGQIVELAGTWDVPLTKKYRLYRTAQTLHRRLRRR